MFRHGPCLCQVQNTFINIVSPRPETQPLSCPASRIGCLKALFGEDDSPKASATLVKEVKEKDEKETEDVEDKAWRPRWTRVPSRVIQSYSWIAIFLPNLSFTCHSLVILSCILSCIRCISPGDADVAVADLGLKALGATPRVRPGDPSAAVRTHDGTPRTATPHTAHTGIRGLTISWLQRPYESWQILGALKFRCDCMIGIVVGWWELA